MDTLLTKKEVADIARVCVRTFERLERENKGPPRVKLFQRRALYSREAVSAWLRSREERAAA